MLVGIHHIQRTSFRRWIFQKTVRRACKRYKVFSFFLCGYWIFLKSVFCAIQEKYFFIMWLSQIFEIFIFSSENHVFDQNQWFFIVFAMQKLWKPWYRVNGFPEYEKYCLLELRTFSMGSPQKYTFQKVTFPTVHHREYSFLKVAFFDHLGIGPPRWTTQWKPGFPRGERNPIGFPPGG